MLNILHDLCLSKGVSIAVAESCTSGLIASKLTTFSGSSSYFKGGVIAYQNEIKVNILGVSQLLIDQKTEVSAEVVEQMSKSVFEKFNVDFSVATSGYAGPTGGTINNPIGTVFIAVSSYRSAEVERFVFSGDRQSIVNQATESALKLLYSAVKKQQ